MPVVQNKNLKTKMVVKKIPVFEYGVIWEDPISGHKIGCLDVSKKEDVEKLMRREKAILAIQDPPYNVDINDEFGNLPLEQYINWSEKWIDNTIDILDKNSSLYIWLGADIRNGLQPLPDFMIMMRNKPVKIRNFITMRNQRGYGTQKKLDGNPARIALFRYNFMKKQKNKKIIREWIELTLCDMIDEIFRNGKDGNDRMKIVKKYSIQIYNSQNSHGKK